MRRRVVALTALTAVTVVTGSIASADGPAVDDIVASALVAASVPQVEEVAPTSAAEVIDAATERRQRVARTPARVQRPELLAVDPSLVLHASWYGPGFDGRRTANGEVFDQDAMTAAHKTLPFGTLLRVTNPRNGRSVVVRINDRGPFIPGRDIDLSRGAAEALGIYGVASVVVTEL